jgi:hypothetical protein
MKCVPLSYLTGIMLLLLFRFPALNGQNNTRSPYSIFGIGELQHRGFGYTQAMGGTGIGIRSNEYLNMLNPASYSAIDSGSMHFDTGMHLEYSTIKNASQKQDFLNGNLSYIAMGFPVWKKWSAGLSLLPFSNVGYEINAGKIIEGTSVPYHISATGTGGLSQINLISSLEVFSFLSVGLSAGYNFGSLELNREIGFGENASVVTIDEKRKYHGWTVELGLQLSKKMGKGSRLTLGGLYRPSTRLYGRSSYDIQLSSDSAYQDEHVLKNLEIPSMMGMGFSVLVNEKIMWSADFSLSKWSAASDNYRDNMVLSSGLEWLPDRRNYQRYLSRISYRIGARYESGYLMVNHHAISTYVATIGVGLPFRNIKNRFNLTLETGRQGTLKHSLIQEQYFRFILNVNLQDIWFRKYKYD